VFFQRPAASLLAPSANAPQHLDTIGRFGRSFELVLAKGATKPDFAARAAEA
jgi:hypothetical protein